MAADGPKQDFIGLALNADLDDWTIRSELGQAKRESLGYKARFHLLTVGYRIVGGSDTLNFAVRAVPEPSTWAQLLLGGLLIGAVWQRRRASGARPR